MRLAILAALIVALAVPAFASGSAYTASVIAQDYQTRECKDIGGVWWHCYQSRTVAQGCQDIGNPYYDCAGVFTQQWLTGGLRSCNLYIHVQKGTGNIVSHYDTCLH